MEFGLGEGVLSLIIPITVMPATVDMLITGDDKDGKVMHDAGHTVFNAGNTYSGKTLVNDGLLTIASHTADGVTGMGSSEVTIASRYARHSRINEQRRRLHADQCAQRRWLDASAAVILRQDVWLYPCNRD